MAFLLCHMHPAGGLADLLDFAGRRRGGALFSAERFCVVIAVPAGTGANLSCLHHPARVPDLSAVSGRHQHFDPGHHVCCDGKKSGTQRILQPVVWPPVQRLDRAGTCIPGRKHPFEHLQQRHLVPDPGNAGVVAVSPVVLGGQPKQGDHQPGALRRSVRHFGIEHAIQL